MKASLLLLYAAGTILLASCSQTTLENRRDMYFPQKVNGPYTRMAEDGIPEDDEDEEEVTVVTQTETTQIRSSGK